MHGFLVRWAERFYSEQTGYCTNYLVIYSTVNCLLEIKPKNESKKRMRKIVEHLEKVAINESQYALFMRGEIKH